MTKDEAMVAFLKTCPTIQENPLFFNFGDINDNAHQVNTKSDEKSLQKPDVVGNVLKRYTFMVDTFKSVAYNAIVDTGTAPTADENMSEFQEVQDISDWVNEQGDLRNFPLFEPEYKIDSMKTLTERPEVMGVYTTKTSPMAVYRITIQIDFIDTTKNIWK